MRRGLEAGDFSLDPEMEKIWCIFLLVSACAGVSFHATLHRGDALLTTDAHWYTQTLDHYATQDDRTFSQRYYEFTDYFDAPNGPVFLKICPEGPCVGIQNDYSAVLAKRFGAAIVSLEHRYYGQSSPFKTHATENLIYLSSKQALFDLAAFREYYQDLINHRTNSTSDNPWIVIGWSYAGALSAWFKLKFPHLAVGSVASSGIVQAIFEFTKLDEQVAESAGATCSAALRAVTRLAEQGLKKNSMSTKALFNAEQLDVDGDFLYLLADAATTAFQYGNPEILCSPLVAAYKRNEDLLAVYAKYVKDYYIDTLKSSINTYDQKHLKENLAAGDHSSDRLGWYQMCTELGYFQVAPANSSIRSALINVKYHLDLCSNVFENGTFPEVDNTNLYYGGNKIRGDKILFMNGSQDPWRHASKQTSSRNEPAYVIKCQNCAHGVDMLGCPQSPPQIGGNTSKCADPEVAQAGQRLIATYISRWLEDANGSVKYM
ncbi:probable serine protease EDA2 [Selaginella moellendorffii]|uniref:probable serine protease EDA2 n=1 Tax=Selaginella moellendorffii TaxID=88036 RepID=UPI000D1C3298|nr:probable serine protease EDA2 [Selaginella moellendorffii]|eukprot:XP_024540567.1 probable serine protease EDA2 [Selaginella moellendorffii]